MKYLGIDWATREHVVALLDEDGTELDVWTIEQSWAAVCGLLERLSSEGGCDGVVIGIEPGSVRLSGALIAAGYTVYEINPKAASRFRDRSTLSGAKDDRRDALVLAGAVRTDHRWMRPAVLPSDLDAELRLRCRDRQMHVTTRRRVVVQLHRTLAEYYPALLALEMPLTCGLIRALLRAYPTPRKARGAQHRKLASLLCTHRVRKIDVDSLRALLGEETFALSAGVESAYVDRMRSLLAQLDQVERTLDDADEKIEALFGAHPSSEVLMSVPGIGAALGPYIASEIAALMERGLDACALQANAGTAPSTRRSGRQTHGVVRMRRGCHRGLQSALFTVARGSMAKSAWARAYYADARSRGMRRNAALRALSNKWAKIIAVLLSRGTLYDEEVHAAALRRNGVAWAPESNQGVAA